jgi:hypothetical protein
MIAVDLTKFVLRGTFGPFKRDMTRTQIAAILGPDDPGYYPDHAGYGNLVFDCVNRNGPPCYVQIAFPHARYKREPQRAWLEAWPDNRLNWELGCFKPELTIPMLKTFVPELKSIDFVEGTRYSGGRLLNVWVPWSRVDLTFESESNSDEPTLSCIRGLTTDEPSVPPESRV